ncbi:hypothetical protein M0R72_12610 [Candidatus Pacearchaeota archaeon]|nr:hypothetical protein [Candidatus Pacearchaeota archaeon]
MIPTARQSTCEPSRRIPVVDDVPTIGMTPLEQVRLLIVDVQLNNDRLEDGIPQQNPGRWLLRTNQEKLTQALAILRWQKVKA